MHVSVSAHREQSLKLGREARVGHSSSIGMGTVIEDGAQVCVCTTPSLSFEKSDFYCLICVSQPGPLLKISAEDL